MTTLSGAPLQSKDRFKLNLLDAVPRLRAFFMGDLWLERLNFKIIAPFYAAYVALLFLAPQAR